MAIKKGKFIREADGSISFIYGKGQISDCQTVFCFADTVFKEFEGKDVSVSLDIKINNK